MATAQTPLTARSVMTRSVLTVSASDSVHDAMRLLLARGYSGAPVVDEDHRLIGVFSELDAIKALIRATVHELPPSRVGDVMTRGDLVTISPDAGLLDLAHVFLNNRVRRVPVVGPDGRLLGQLSRRDLLQAAVRIFDEAPTREAAALYLSATRDDKPEKFGSTVRRQGTPVTPRHR